MIIYGASGHGKVICDILKKLKLDNIIFIDDADKGNSFYNFPLFKTDNYQIQNEKLIIAIGNNSIRKKISLKYQYFGKAIHPSAEISESCQIGEGTVVMANVTCNADSKIGRHVILNTSCSVDHDCNIGDFVHISPNVSLAGNVKIGEGTHIGIGASVIQGINIGKSVTVGAGAVIIKDIPDGATVVGVPGKIIKTT